jgi:hypothetical protein
VAILITDSCSKYSGSRCRRREGKKRNSIKSSKLIGLIPEDVQRAFDAHQVIDLLAADDPVGAVRIIAQYCGRYR